MPSHQKLWCGIRLTRDHDSFWVRNRRMPASARQLPSGVGAIQPDDIASIDITKHAAGAVAPNAVSIISIVLKPGAKVPLVAHKP